MKIISTCAVATVPIEVCVQMCVCHACVQECRLSKDAFSERYGLHWCVVVSQV